MSLRDNLNALEAAGLIRLAQIEPELEYLFRHALLQDAAYATLLESDRRELHRAVGEAIETLYADRLNEHAGMLARHFERAGDNARALCYLRMALLNALHSYANHEAELLSRRALLLEPEAKMQAEFYEGLGMALANQSRYEEAQAALRCSIDCYAELNDDNRLARVFALAARAASQSGDTAGSLRLVEEGMGRVDMRIESGDIARLTHEAARAYHFSGLIDAAPQLADRALELAAKVDACVVEADALITKSMLPQQDPEESVAVLQQALALAQRINVPAIAGRAHHNLGVIYSSYVGDMHTARDHFAEAVALAQSTGNLRSELFSRINMINIEYKLGRVPDLAARIEELTRLSRQIPNVDLMQLEITSLRSTAARAEGNFAEAFALAQQLLALARANSDKQMMTSGLFSIVDVAVESARHGALPEWQIVHEALDELLQLAEQGFCHIAAIYLKKAVVLALQGDVDEAARYLALGDQHRVADRTLWQTPNMHEARLELARVGGRFAEASNHAEANARFWSCLDARWLWANSLLQWGRVLFESGGSAELKKGQALLREARELFSDMRISFYAGVADHWLEMVRSALYDQASDQERAADELAAASRIQESLLPALEHVPPGWQLVVDLVPARETSGDFYDFIPLSDGRLAIVVADVAGKGAGAALYMAICRTYLRNAFADEQATPATVFADTNRRIVTETRSDMFVTLFCAILDPVSGGLTYANAGHNPPILVGSDGVAVELIKTGMVLGVAAEVSWQTETLLLEPGAQLCIYTDGIIDAPNAEGERFGVPRLRQLMLQNRALPAVERLGLAQQALTAFVGQTAQFDDMTLLLLQRDS